MKKKMSGILALFMSLCLLWGCTSAKPTAPVTSERESVTSTVTSVTESVASEVVVPESVPSSEVSNITSGIPVDAEVPKTSQKGKYLKLTEAEIAEIEAYLTSSMAVFGQFEYTEIDDEVLLNCGINMSIREKKTKTFPDGRLGVSAKTFEDMIYGYFGKRIEQPQQYAEDNPDNMETIYYDGDYYKWDGSFYMAVKAEVDYVQDLGNGFIKCVGRAGDLMEDGETYDGVGEMICIIRKHPDSPYKYNFFASDFEGLH